MKAFCAILHGVVTLLLTTAGLAQDRFVTHGGLRIPAYSENKKTLWSDPKVAEAIKRLTEKDPLWITGKDTFKLNDRANHRPASFKITHSGNDFLKIYSVMGETAIVTEFFYVKSEMIDITGKPITHRFRATLNYSDGKLITYEVCLDRDTHKNDVPFFPYYVGTSVRFEPAVAIETDKHFTKTFLEMFAIAKAFRKKHVSDARIRINRYYDATRSVWQITLEDDRKNVLVLLDDKTGKTLVEESVTAGDTNDLWEQAYAKRDTFVDLRYEYKLRFALEGESFYEDAMFLRTDI